MRHSWSAEKFSGSMVCHKHTARCVRCDAIRERHFDYGQYRMIYRASDVTAPWVAKAPICEADPR